MPKPAPVAGVAGKKAKSFGRLDQGESASDASRVQQQAQVRKSLLNVQDYDPNAMGQTGPGVPAWTWAGRGPS